MSINEYRAGRSSEQRAETPIQETPSVASPEPSPAATTPPKTAPAPAPERTLPRWRANLDPYFDKVDELGKKIKAAKGRDSLNVELSPLNSLGKALNNPKETYAPLREEALVLLKGFRTAAKIESMLARDAATKKRVRKIESEIELEISKLKTELNKLEHLRHPIRSARIAARSWRDSVKEAF